MALKEEFEKTGGWLFRWRSYLPLVVVALFLLAFRNFRYPYDSQALARFWETICLLISFIGLGIRIATLGFVPAGTSGRNTKGQVARVLNTTGMYSIVRHPLYLGNFFIWLGLSLFLRSFWFSSTIVLLFWLYYERIMFAEEHFLREKFGAEFSEWAERTPAFFPNIKKWQSLTMTFSLRTVLRKEYSSFFAIMVSFTVLKILGELFIHGRLGLDRLWLVLFGISLIIYLVLRMLKKWTTVLNVEGR
jgi:protein-S-isoprenylcysteine O-methyltransferase Ste14